MNIMQQVEQLKMLPDQQIQMMLARPGSIAPYLVAAEAQRRETMRAQAQAGRGNPMEQGTVAEDIAGRLNPNPPQPQEQRMATGGLVDLSGYMQMMQGAQPTAADIFADPRYAPAMSQAEIDQRYAPAEPIDQKLAKLRTMRGESPLLKIADELAQERSALRNKKTGLGEILMNLGLGMAASRRPDFAGAVAEGGIGALNQHIAMKNQREQQAAAMLAKQAALLGDVQRSDDVLFREAGELNRADQAGRNTTIMTAENARTAQARAAANAANEALQRQTQQNIEEIRDKRERDLKANEAAAKKEDAATQHGYRIAEINQRGKSKGQGKPAKAPSPDAELKKQMSTAGVILKDGERKIKELTQRRMRSDAAGQAAIDQQIAEVEQAMSQWDKVRTIAAYRLAGMEPPPPMPTISAAEVASILGESKDQGRNLFSPDFLASKVAPRQPAPPKLTTLTDVFRRGQ